MNYLDCAQYDCCHNKAGCCCLNSIQVRHTGDSHTQRRHAAFADDIRRLGASELIAPARPRLTLLNTETGELLDG